MYILSRPQSCNLSCTLFVLSWNCLSSEYFRRLLSNDHSCSTALEVLEVSVSRHWALRLLQLSLVSQYHTDINSVQRFNWFRPLCSSARESFSGFIDLIILPVTSFVQSRQSHLLQRLYDLSNQVCLLQPALPTLIITSPSGISAFCNHLCHLRLSSSCGHFHHLQHFYLLKKLGLVQLFSPLAFFSFSFPLQFQLTSTFAFLQILLWLGHSPSTFAQTAFQCHSPTLGSNPPLQIHISKTDRTSAKQYRFKASQILESHQSPFTSLHTFTTYISLPFAHSHLLPSFATKISLPAKVSLNLRYACHILDDQAHS